MILDTFPCLNIEILERKMKNLDEDLRALFLFLSLGWFGRSEKRREKEFECDLIDVLGRFN